MTTIILFIRWLFGVNIAPAVDAPPPTVDTGGRDSDSIFEMHREDGWHG